MAARATPTVLEVKEPIKAMPIDPLMPISAKAMDGVIETAK